MDPYEARDKKGIVTEYLTLRVKQLQGWINEAAAREDDRSLGILTKQIDVLGSEKAWLDSANVTVHGTAPFEELYRKAEGGSFHADES